MRADETQCTVAWLWSSAASQKCLTPNRKKNKNRFWELKLKTFLFKTWFVVRNSISAIKTLPAVILESIRDIINLIWFFYINMAPPTKKERCKECWATGRCFMRRGLYWLCTKCPYMYIYHIYTHTLTRELAQCIREPALGPPAATLQLVRYWQQGRLGELQLGRGLTKQCVSRYF